MTTHTDSTKRHDFALLFDVTNGNPNGDPDAGNLPRTDPETMHGLVTDVALKRKIRNYVALLKNQRIFIQSEVSLNSLILKGFRDAGVPPPQISFEDEELEEWFEERAGDEGFPFTLENGMLVYAGESPRKKDIVAALTQSLGDSNEDKARKTKLLKLADELVKAAANKKMGRQEQSQARSELCQDYYDIRMFGAVLATGLNAGQVRGPVQLTFARSIDPILVLDLSITRLARTTSERMQSGTTEMGRKAIVPYGLYRAHGFFNPMLGATRPQGTGVSDQDLEILWEALTNMFEIDRSAARPEMGVRGLYVFSHDSPLGNYPSHRLFPQVRVARKERVESVRSFDDYSVDAPEAGEVAVDGKTNSGVTFTAVVHKGEVLWRAPQ
jgi:CRISPR-associated protein Csd2